MSQAKVDRYKEEKRNRKETMAKEKRKHTLSVIAGSLVAVVLAGWIGVSGYNMYQLKSNNKVFSGGSVVRNPPPNVGDTGSIPGPRRSHMSQTN